ncbi:MAG: Maf family nucleotide pyrophosphatase [Chlamydiota bacterium]
MEIILGSASPRRKEILSYFSLPFKQVTSHFKEEDVPFLNDPKQYTALLAQKKALALAEAYPNDIILTADTTVFVKNKLFNKPSNEQEAIQMLRELSGSWHQVFTGVCVRKEKLFFVDVEESRIEFHALTEKQIQAYHKSFYFLDKAGGYAIQEGGSIVVKKIDGCFYNIMGFPINTVRELLLRVGIDLWDYLKSSL